MPAGRFTMIPLKLYVPAGGWVVKSVTEFCEQHDLGNASVSGIGSITNIWVLINPDGKLVIKNFSAGPSYEMTSLLGNVTLRQGKAQFDPAGLSTGSYPQFDDSDSTLNSYAHLHVTFANPDMSISGGHLLDAQVSIGAELIITPMASDNCVPGLDQGDIPAGCVFNEPVNVAPYGTFYNWDQRFWFTPTED